MSCASNKTSGGKSITTDSSHHNISNYKKFDEEFFSGKTFDEYRRFDNEFCNTGIFQSIIPEMSEEQWKEYSTIVTSPFHDESMQSEIKYIKYIERDYYSAFYLENTDESKRELPNSFVPYFNGIWLGDASDIKEDDYRMHVKFKNYATLEDVQYRYENFYLCRVFKLIDLYEGDTYLSSGYKMNFWVANDSDEVCFYDYWKRDGKEYFSPQYQDNPKYITYFDKTKYSNSKLLPFFPHPYDKTTPMITRVEIDGEYAYYPFQSSWKTEWEVISKGFTIRQYDPQTQKVIAVQENQLYAKIPLSSLL